MMKVWGVIALLLLAQVDWPKEGQCYESFSVDLNRDGKKEKVGLVAYKVTQDEYFGRLVVWGSDGKVLWKQAPVSKASEPMAFGAWNFGIADLELVGDLNGDGSVELVGPLPQSDVSPTTYRLLRWNGKAFAPVFQRSLLRDREGHYGWSQDSGRGGPAEWISEFQGLTAEGTTRARIYRYDPDQGSVKIGSAVLKPDAQGFTLVRWAEPLK